MVDIDYYKEGTSQSQEEILTNLRKYCEEHPQYRFKVYSTQNGLHAFLVSSSSDYRSEEAIKMMLDLGSDFFYVVYCYLRGWSVRLNKKKRDTKDELYTYITDIGTAPADEYLLKLVQLHLNLTTVFKGVPPCLMYGG